jgi:hypothetical protein
MTNLVWVASIPLFEIYLVLTTGQRGCVPCPNRELNKLLEQLKIMDENFNEHVMCCFCGNSLKLEDAVVLSVLVNIKAEEAQGLYCHKQHLLELLDKSVILHPDFFDENNV